MPNVQEHQVEAVCERLLELLSQLHPKTAKAVSRATYSEPYVSLPAKEKKFAKVRILAEQYPGEFDSALTATFNPQEAVASLTRSSFSAFVANMPHLKGDKIFSYKEMSGGNYKKL